MPVLVSCKSGKDPFKNEDIRVATFLKTVKMIIFRYFFLDIFLIFAQNKDCGYTFQPPH